MMTDDPRDRVPPEAIITLLVVGVAFWIALTLGLRP